MDKLKMQSPNLVDANIEKIVALFPNCITEDRDESGKIRRAVDFDLLRQELSANLVEGPQERYTLSWPGKNEAILTANAPIAKTLRPCEEESVDFENTRNLYIEGDNLDVLKLLQETYLNTVKMIFIDPPYNTGNDFIYEDDFAEDTDSFLKRSNQKDEIGYRMVANTEANGRRHSDWLSMMYSRLKLARNILREDGLIFISIDENECHNLRKVCDEVFGESNFAGEIVWKNSSKNDQSYISIQHEYMLCFVKNKSINSGNWEEKKEGLEEIYKAFELFKKKHGNNWDEIHKEALAWFKQFPESNPISSSKHYNWMDEKGVYFAADISGPNFGQYRYNVIHPVTGKICKEPSSGWRFPEETMKQRICDNFVHFGKDEKTVPNNKTYIKDTEYQSLTSVKYKDGRVASKLLTKLMGGKYFTNPKDVDFLNLLFKAVKISENDIILDFFSGSATTAHSVMQLNAEDNGTRKFIMVQLPEPYDEKSEAFKAGYKTIAEIGKERIRRAGKKIKEEWEAKQPTLLDAPSADNTLDIGFRVFKVDTSNMKDVYYTPDELKQNNLELFKDHIKSDRRPEDLLFQVFLDWGIDLALPIAKETIDEKKVFIVDTNALLACFDSGITEELVKKLAKHKPLRAVFRDAAFGSDSVKINVEQIFKLLSPGTEVKSI